MSDDESRPESGELPPERRPETAGDDNPRESAAGSPAEEPVRDAAEPERPAVDDSGDGTAGAERSPSAEDEDEDSAKEPPAGEGAPQSGGEKRGKAEEKREKAGEEDGSGASPGEARPQEPDGRRPEGPRATPPPGARGPRPGPQPPGRPGRPEAPGRLGPGMPPGARPGRRPGPPPGARRPGPGPAGGPTPQGRPPYPGAGRPGRGPVPVHREHGPAGPPRRPPHERRPAPGGAGRPAGSGASPGEPRPTGRQRLARAVWPPRVTRAQLIVALLLFVLGLGLAIQVRSTSENSALRGARQEDLVRILDELDDRTKRLEDEKQSLERQRTELDNSSDQAEEARKQTASQQRRLGILAGTVPARGPGIAITVTDPADKVEGDLLLDTVQELRAAGAEAIEINDTRVVAGTYFSEGGGGVRVDGHRITKPYRFEAIGNPKDLEPALHIPGGVVQSFRDEDASVSVTRSQKVTVDAVRSAKKPRYADPSSH